MPSVRGQERVLRGRGETMVPHSCIVPEKLLRFPPAGQVYPRANGSGWG